MNGVGGIFERSGVSTEGASVNTRYASGILSCWPCDRPRRAIAARRRQALPRHRLHFAINRSISIYRLGM